MKCRICFKTNTVSLKYKDVEGFRFPRKFDVYYCTECEVGFTHPFLTDKEYQEFHDVHQVAFNGAGDDEVINSYLANKEAVWKGLKLEKRHKEILKQNPKTKRVLDIGCGAGIYLDFLKSKGLDVEGIEISPWGYRMATKKLGLKIHNQPIGKLKTPRKKFDVITMYDVLEHTTDPIKILEEVKEWLEDYGILIINLPNLGSVIARASGKYWNKLAPPDHTFHFKKAGLKKLLEKADYKVENISTNHGSPTESFEQIVMSSWRIPAKFSKKMKKNLDMAGRPFGENKTLGTALIKSSKVAASKIGFLGYGVLPFISMADAGEGIRLIARKT